MRKYNNAKVVNQILKRKEKEYIDSKKTPDNTIAKRQAKKKKRKTEIVITADRETYTKSRLYLYSGRLRMTVGKCTFQRMNRTNIVIYRLVVTI